MRGFLYARPSLYGKWFQQRSPVLAMVRLAVCIGINNYPNQPLAGCVTDARAMAEHLGRNADDSPNYQVRLVVSDNGPVTRAKLREELSNLFVKDRAEAALFYFAGHGRKERAGAYLVTEDESELDAGVPMSEVIGWANACGAGERIIILDCCFAGAIKELVETKGTVPLNDGVTILAACRSDELSMEEGDRGLFTRHVCDALDGGAADVRGQVTVSSVYSYVSEVLGHWDQSPHFMGSLSKMTTLRRAAATVSDDELRNLRAWFDSVDCEFALDPSFEPSAEPRSEENERTFAVLQKFRNARLIVPVGEEHLYDAAMNSKACALTPTGKFYWQAVSAGRI